MPSSPPWVGPDPTDDTMGRGWFITFEGNEGCGKSTQIRRLAGALEAAGARVVTVREPGGTPLGERIRHLLQHAPEGNGMAAETELLLFAASRAQLVREVIRPALEAGAVVLSDRFLDSTTVYQGVARRLAPAEVAAINRFAVGETMPDATLVLDVPVALGRARVAARVGAAADRMEQEAPAFYHAVREGYLELARSEPGRVRLIDGARSEEAVASEIRAVLEERCHGLFASAGV